MEALIAVPKIAFKVADPLTVMTGHVMFSVNACEAAGGIPLFAPSVSGYAWLTGEPVTPCVPAAGVPLIVAVPFMLLVKTTPAGSAPVSVMTMDAPEGAPVVVTVKDPAKPGAKVTALALVIAGGEMIVVESVPVLLPALLSFCAVVTVIEFTCGEDALAATLTVTRSAG